MLRRFFSLIFVFASVTGVFAAQPRAKSHKPKAKAPVAQPQPQPAQVAPAPQIPVQPPTPESGPASPPDVVMRGGQLTITAPNSTLSDVLNAVKQKTGAAVDIPAASSERVVGKFGPGAPRDVMAQLLNGSHFDYILLGSPTDPGALNKIVLMARAAGPEMPQQPQPQAFQQNLQAVPQVDTGQAAEDNNADVVPEQPAPEEEPQAQGQPDQQQPEQPPFNPNGPQVKTPEQLLRELQQQQQHQQFELQNSQQER